MGRSEWTVDTLHTLMLTLLAEQSQRYHDGLTHQQNMLTTLAAERQRAVDRAFEAANRETHEHLDQQRREIAAALLAHDKFVAEVDRRHSEQRESSERAVKTALDAAERAVTLQATAASREFHEHLTQYRHEVTLAFEASDKAITKAELATERRFESVNEFRAQLSDQAARFVPKTEFDGQVHALRTEQQAAASRNAERIEELQDRVNRSEGKGTGLSQGWIYLLGTIAALGTLITLYLALRGG